MAEQRIRLDDDGNVIVAAPVSAGKIRLDDDGNEITSKPVEKRRAPRTKDEESTLTKLKEAGKEFVSNPDFRAGFTKHVLTEEPATMAGLGTLGVMGAGALGAPAAAAGVASAAVPLAADLVHRGSRYVAGKPQAPVSAGEVAEILAGPALQYGGPMIKEGAKAVLRLAPETKKAIGGIVGSIAGSKYGATGAAMGGASGFYKGPAVMDSVAKVGHAAGNVVDRVAQGARGKTGMRFPGPTAAEDAGKAATEATAAEVLRLKNLKAANKAQYQYDEGAAKVATKAAKDAANRSKVSDAMAGRQPTGTSVTDTVKSDGKTVTTRYAVPEEAVEDVDDLLSQFGGNQDALNRFKAQQAGGAGTPPARVMNYPGGSRPGAVRVAAPAKPTATYSHTGPDGPKFKVVGGNRSDVSARQLREMGVEVPDVPAPAAGTRATETAARDAALARQNARAAERAAAKSKLDEGVNSMEVVDGPGPNASGESAASAEALSRQSGMKTKGESFVVVDRAGKSRPLIGPDAVDYTPVKGETFGVQGPGGFRVLEDNGGKVGKSIEGALLKRAVAPEGELSPSQAKVIQDALGLKFPPKTLSPKGREVLDRMKDMRMREGAEATGDAFGMSRTDVSLLDPGDAGIMPTGINAAKKRGLADLETRIKDLYGSNPTKAELTEYLRRSPNGNPALINYMQRMIDNASH